MFEHPLGLIALLALPAIAYLHLFRRKFQPRTVSALFLWSDESRTPISGRQRERLPKSLSLACELLAALCLALALAGPRGCSERQAEHLVVTLDGSASMGARARGGRTVADDARVRVEERIRALPNGSRVTVVQSGARPDVIVGPAAFPKEALRGLERYVPTAMHHDLAPSLALALQISGGGRVWCVTDALAQEVLQDDVEVLALGAPSDNVAIVHASRAAGFGANAERDSVELTLASFASVERDVQVTAVLPLEGDRAVSEAKSVRLQPRERRTLRFEIASAAGPLEVRIDDDALAIDDRAWLAPLPRRTVSLRAELSESNTRALRLASGSSATLGRWLDLAEDVREAPDATSAHVLLTDGAPGGPATWTIEFAPLGAERKEFIGPFLADKRQPLLAGTTLEGIVWSTDPGVRLSGAPLVSAGNLPILVEDRRDGARAFVFAIDPSRSSLQRSLDWPILLANLIEMRRAELPGASATNLYVGDEVLWRAATSEMAVLRLVGPRLEREITERPVTALAAFERPGLYALERGGQTVARFGVTFSDATESDLSTRTSGERPSTAASASARPTTSWIALLFLVLALAALLADWWVLGERSTTSPAHAVRGSW